MRWLLPGLCCLLSFSVSGQELYFIDAHSQVDHEVDNLALIIQRMDENSVRKTILAARGGRRPHEVAEFSEQYPDRIVPAVRSKSGAYITGKEKYYRYIADQFKDARFRAIAEVLLYHAQKGEKAGEVTVHLKDPRVDALLQVALERGIPFVAHIEFAALAEPQRQQFMQEFEQILKQYPEHPFVLIHMGQLKVKEAGILLKKYRNFHLMTSHADPVTVDSSNQPWINMFVNGSLKDEWKILMEAHPEQFVFALDNVWADHWKDTYARHVELWANALQELPEEVAHAVAHRNAERLWKL